MRLEAGKTLKKYGARWVLGLALCAVAILHTVNVLHMDALDRMDTFVSGLRMRLETPVLDPRVVIVDIDEKSLAEVGRFPWSRNVMARLVEQLTVKYEVAAVGFDVSFPEPDTSSGYDVLEKLSKGELKDVTGLGQQLKRLQPELDYDGLLAKAIEGQPVVLGLSLIHI